MHMITDAASYTSEEIQSQPSCWEQAATLFRDQPEVLPPPGARLLVIGCGTSLYICLLYTSPSPRDS